MINTLGLADSVTTVATSQPSCALYATSGHGCVPIKLHLKKKKLHLQKHTTDLGE